MKGFWIKSAMAGAHFALAGALVGCLWVDEDVPERIIVEPAGYEPSPVVPVTVGGFDGYRLPTTAAIRSFLGGSDFRIAVTLPDETFGLYVLEPGEPDQPPRIRRYSRGQETFTGRKASWYGYCSLSPDGKRLAYSLTGGGEASIPPTVWMLDLGPDPARRVPLFSRSNRSYGMFGENPYWHAAGGRSFIGFLGGSLQGGDEAIRALPMGGKEAQMVEVLPDSNLSPVFPVRVGRERVLEDLRGITRDSQWVMIRNSAGGSFLLPAARVPDLPDLRAADSLTRFYAGKGASLNPFDSGSTRHTDFHAVPAYQYSASTGNLQDTLADPRTLDGRRVTGLQLQSADNFWVCDADRRIHYSRRVGQQALDRAIWTTHPNFVLAIESFTAIHLVRLAGSKEDLLGGGDEATRRADGVLALFTPDMTTWSGQAFQDISMWIQP